ncbi:hypothetical protein EFR01_15230 [Sinorhizobium fredii]|nr:hypothetical protein EFR01_15230 [Sinorhizobium fredii]GLS11022.1 hypothetical protein GCM10007864_46530 [Sinorhizobium fredii]
MTSRPAYHFNSIIVREPSRSVVDGLRAEDRGSPTYEGVKAEHDAYLTAMREAGVKATVLPPLEGFPDSIFVEDPALVFTEGAIVLRPGAATRVQETEEIAPTLREMFETVIDLPAGYADGGDVLTTRESVMIGLSARTDRAGPRRCEPASTNLAARATSSRRRRAFSTSKPIALCLTTKRSSPPIAWRASAFSRRSGR